uniref:Reverse transcriptase domain-containing protein n=1 Tax=Aegilops tauschii subsp. strangulata TaxID=200361 RepID=A0A453BJN6_AEGTS
MQQAPLLEKLDWVFTSESWTSHFPNTLVQPLSKPVSDHIPCQVQVGTHIPKSKIFRFENFWLQIEGFKDIVKQNWEQAINIPDSAKRITAKFKRLRKCLKIWAKSISQLSISIKATNEVILFLDSIEDFRTLTLQEWNGREFLKQHLHTLLERQRVYWQQRATIRWVKFGEANSKYFQAKATIKYKVNHIASLQDDLGNIHREHNAKANILFNAFKKRLNTSVPTFNPLNFGNLLNRDVDFSLLEIPFSQEEIDTVVKNLPNDKAPGPDGFNTNFIKHCWDILPLISTL